MHPANESDIGLFEKLKSLLNDSVGRSPVSLVRMDQGFKQSRTNALERYTSVGEGTVYVALGLTGNTSRSVTIVAILLWGDNALAQSDAFVCVFFSFG